MLLFAWVIVLACCVVMTVFYTMSWGVCNTDEIGWDEGTIDFYPFHFLFPAGKRSEAEGPRNSFLIPSNH